MRVCVAVAAAWTAGVAGAGTPGCGEWEVLPIYGGGYMQDVVIAPSATNVWYTHADVCGPFRSDDAGKSWRPLHQHFPVAWRQTKVDHVRGILVDPRNANRVLVAGGDVWDYTGGGIVVSDDGGETWRMTLKGAHFYGNSRRRMHGRVLSRDPFDVDTIVAGEDLDGIWLSRDNGETWRNVGLSNHWFTCVAFDTAVRGRIWATAPGQKTDSPQDDRLAGFYRSDDYGATWTAIACDNPPWEFTQLKRGGPIVAIFDRMHPRALSADGLQWTDWFDGLPIRSTPPKNAWDKGNFFALGANADFYLLGDGAGQIWRRGRHDTRWTQRPLVRRAVGVPRRERWIPLRTHGQQAMSQFVIDPNDADHWLTTDWFAIWETTDAGASWTTRVNGIQQLVPFRMAFDPNSADNIAYGVADMGLFMSIDGGQTYFPPVFRYADATRGAELVTSAGCDISYSTKTPGLVYVTGGKREPLFRVSADAGRTWKKAALKGLPENMRNGGIAPYTVVVHPVSDEVWVAVGGPCVKGKGGIYRSADRGETWVWAGEGLPEGACLFRNSEFGHGHGHAIQFSRDGSAAIAAAHVGRTVFWLDVATGRWSEAAAMRGLGSVQAVADPATPGRFLVGGNPAMESTDGGRTWKPLEGLRAAGACSGFAADAQVPGLFAVSTYDQIWYSTDGARTFKILPDALATVPSSMRRTIYLDRGMLYFLTTGTGVWRRPLPVARPRTTAERGVRPALDAWLKGFYGTLPYAEYSIIDRAARALEGNAGGRLGDPDCPWHPLRAARPSSTRRFLGIWNWDCAFMALAMAKWDANLARDQFRAFARLQAPDGMYPDCWRMNEPFAFVGCTKPPVLAWAVWAAERAEGDKDFLTEAYKSLARNLDWWKTRRRRPGDTLFHYDGEATDEKTRRLYTGWESGMDDSPRWDGGRPWQLWPVDLNCYMVMSYRAMAEFAVRLGLPQEAGAWAARARELSAALETALWDEEQGCYADWDFGAGRFSRVLTPAAFLPLYIGTATPARAARMAEAAKRLSPGWPTVAYDDPTYSDGYWRGRTWLNVAYFALKGLKYYGHDQLAETGRRQLFTWMLRESASFNENYNSRNGQVRGAEYFGWSNAFAIKLVLDWNNRRDEEMPVNGD